MSNQNDIVLFTLKDRYLYEKLRKRFAYYCRAERSSLWSKVANIVKI
jgi:hypothetical protein